MAAERNTPDEPETEEEFLEHEEMCNCETCIDYRKSIEYKIYKEWEKLL
jgi:hypothetical protein